MRLKVYCERNKQDYIVPLLNTLYVSGISRTLISIITLTNQGHEVAFGFSTVRIIFNANLQNPLEIRLRHVFHNRHRSNPFANNAVSTRSPPTPSYAAIAAATPRPITPVVRPKRKVSLELLHHRLGHQNHKALLAAHEAAVWNDVLVEFAPSDFCIGCKIGVQRQSNRGDQPVAQATRPGEIWFCDIQTNPFARGLTSASHCRYQLIFTCAFSRYTVLVGTNRIRVSDVCDAITQLVQHFGPTPNFSVSDISTFHADAASQFISLELETWLGSFNPPTNLVAAAPHHQHQNGMVERR